MAAAAFLALEYPYATAAGIGTGVFAISYLAAKKATRAPNDNLWYLLTGGGYIDPVGAAIDAKNQTSFWSHPITWTEGWFAENGGSAAKPLYKDGKPYYKIDGKDYTPQELYMSLHAGNGVPVRPNNWPTDLNVDDTRQDVGHYRPSASNPNLLVQDPTLAKQVPSFYPTAAVDQTGKPREGPTKANAALSLAEQNYVAAHAQLFQQVYGNKELSSSDVAQVWVAAAHAIRPDKRGNLKEKSWVNAGEWANLKSEEAQKKYDKDLEDKAKKWAQQVGTGDPTDQFKNPPKESTWDKIKDFFGTTKGQVSTAKPAAAPAPAPKPVIAIPQRGPYPNWLDGPPAAVSSPVIPSPPNTAPARKPTRGRGW